MILTASDLGGTGGGVRDTSELETAPRGHVTGYDRAAVVPQPLLTPRIASVKDDFGIWPLR